MSDRGHIALALFDKYITEIRATLCRYVRNRSDTDEMAQEVFLRLLTADKERTQAHCLRSDKAYLLTIARNVALDYLRHKQVVRIDFVGSLSEEAMEMFNSAPDDDVRTCLEAEEEIQQVLDAAERVPEKCRIIFMLKKVYGFSQKEIAAAMKISENTVEQHLTKAARQIATHLEGTAGSYIQSAVSDFIGYRRTKK